MIAGHSNDESRELLRGFGMPFKADEESARRRSRSAGRLMRVLVKSTEFHEPNLEQT